MDEIRGSDLITWGLVDRAPGTVEAFDKLWPKLSTNGKADSFIVKSFWTLVEHEGLSNNIRGSLFEALVGLLLLRRGIEPFFRQAELAYVNNARFDFVLWEEGEYPISLSLKTSLRERYKQAILESDALKSVHRVAQSYLITLDHEAVRTRQQRADDRSQFSSIDGFVLADSVEFDGLLDHLQELSFAIPKPISPQLNSKMVKRIGS